MLNLLGLFFGLVLARMIWWWNEGREVKHPVCWMAVVFACCGFAAGNAVNWWFNQYTWQWLMVSLVVALCFWLGLCVYYWLVDCRRPLLRK